MDRTRTGGGRSSSGLEYPRYLDFARWTQAVSRNLPRSPIATWRSATARRRSRARRSASSRATYFDFFDARPVLGRFFTAREDALPAGDAGHRARLRILAIAVRGPSRRPRIDRFASERGTYTIIGVAPPGFEGVSDQTRPDRVRPAHGVRARAVTRDYYTGLRLELARHHRPAQAGRDASTTANADLTNAYRRSWNAERVLEPSTRRRSTSRDPVAIAGPIQAARGPNGRAGVEGSRLDQRRRVRRAAHRLRERRQPAARARAAPPARDRACAARSAARARDWCSNCSPRRSCSRCSAALAGLLAAQFATGSLRDCFSTPADDWPVLTDARTLGVRGRPDGRDRGARRNPARPAVGARRSCRISQGGHTRRTATASRARGRRCSSFQTALSVVLLVGAGLFVRSLQAVRALRLGYDVDRLAYVEASMRGVKLTHRRRRATRRSICSPRRARTPGVDNATQVVSVPFWSSEGRGLFVAGIDSVRKLGRFTLQAGTPEYFATVGHAHRPRPRHSRPTIAPTRRASSSSARRWPRSSGRDQDPIGKCIRISSDTMPCTTVVGVAEDIRARR